MYSQALPDPRPQQKNAPHDANTFVAPLYAAIATYLTAPTQDEKDQQSIVIFDYFKKNLNSTAPLTLDEITTAAPTIESARVAERLIESWELTKPQEGELGLQFFAFPVIFVVAAEQQCTIPTILSQKEEIEALLQQHSVLGEAQQWGISNALCTAEALIGTEWPRWMKQQAEQLQEITALQHLQATDLDIKQTNQEQVFLRFIVGSAIISSKTNWHAKTNIAAWGMGLSNLLSQQIKLQGTTLLALPRSPKALTAAVQEGRKAQREVGLQLFVSDAVRRCRSSFGEPVVVLSSHLLQNNDGEIRISISSPFSSKDAQGFRFPLMPTERIADAQRQIATLLEECRLQDIRILQNVYPDKEDQTGLTLLFKPESIPDEELVF